MATERSSSRRRVDFLTLLPDSLLQKILLPLPVESLVSLASTCKKWRVYLTDDDFARLHLDQWRSRYGILHISVINLVYLPIFDGETNKLILARLEDCFSRNLKEDNRFRVLDSCDGLFLIGYGYYINSRLVVCNPLMRSYKLLQRPPTRMWGCHWKMVYDASIKRYKIIAITREKWITKNEVRGRQFYILELCRSSSESEWKEVFVCDDELGGGDFGGKVHESVLVDEKGKKKLYYLTYNDDRFPGNEFRTSVICIDIETHQVKAVEAGACSSMSLSSSTLWVGSSSTGRFYMNDYFNLSEELFVLDDLHNPIWKKRLMNGNDRFPLFVHMLAVVRDNGHDEEDKILYQDDGKIYEYQIGTGQHRLVLNNSGHCFSGFSNHGYYHAEEVFVTHLHSLIIM